MIFAILWGLVGVASWVACCRRAKALHWRNPYSRNIPILPVHAAMGPLGFIPLFISLY